ncbi:type IV pilin protein [Bdellovibrio sp. HCB-162]|uniref:type IV pilin protein n=1 Tax=Bdellovibrio sp. HCB-162 TaxID=3394234 RepID=UPI0039BD6577
MSFSSRNSQRGFSLVELMVVVAIIGILAAIAIPSVNKYMAKARQSEAKTNLASLYTAEKAFFSEYNIYDSRFGAVGYVPEGGLRYNIGFTGTTQAGPTNNYTLTPTITGISASAVCNNSNTANYTNGCKMLAGVTGQLPPAIVAGMCPASPSVATAGCTTNANGTFMAGAGARISASAGVDDYWAIDSSKQLRNTQDGIR